MRLSQARAGTRSCTWVSPVGDRNPSNLSHHLLTSRHSSWKQKLGWSHTLQDGIWECQAWPATSQPSPVTSSTPYPFQLGDLHFINERKSWGQSTQQPCSGSSTPVSLSWRWLQVLKEWTLLLCFLNAEDTEDHKPKLLKLHSAWRKLGF